MTVKEKQDAWRYRNRPEEPVPAYPVYWMPSVAVFPDFGMFRARLAALALSMSIYIGRQAVVSVFIDMGR
jgi:hypothetical protein